jgi:hypothetical protein
LLIQRLLRHGGCCGEEHAKDKYVLFSHKRV